MANTRVKKIIYKIDDSDLRAARKSLSQTGKVTKDLEEKTERYRKEVKKTGDQGEKSFMNFNNAIKLISFAAIVAGLKQLGSQVIKIGSEFQRLEAVLSTALGSNSKAQVAMRQIQDFAAKTPFQVTALTNAFVKLANQGFVPTSREMRKLGDLASSTGKEFDQLAEAILDAAVGEFERLKEFGIRAEKHGDQVKFTFRGIKTEVDFTRDAIQNYILSLGEAEGISGSMEKISNTLGGKISNLYDQFDRLFQLISEQSDGPVTKTLELISKSINGLNKQLESQADKELELVVKKYEKLKETFEGLSNTGLELQLSLISKQLEVTSEAADKAADNYSEVSAKFGEGDPVSKRAFENLVKLRTSTESLKLAQDDLLESLKKINDKNLERDEAIQRALSLYPQITQAIREYNNELRKQQEFDESEGFRKWAKTIKDEWLPVYENIDQVVNDSLEEGNSAADERAKAEERAADRTYNAWKETYDKRKQLEFEALNAGIDAVNMLLQSTIETREMDWEDLQERRDNEIELAGDNNEAKRQIEERFRVEEKAMRRKQEEEEKKAAVKRILIDTAANVVRSILNNGGVPLGLPFGAIALGLGLAQATAVRGFKDGVIDLDGPGTGTSDSIHARLSKGESVITARNTQRSKDILKDIQSGKLDDKTYKMLMHGVPVQQRGDVFDDTRIVSAIKDNKPPDYEQVGSILYKYKSRGETSKQRIRSKWIN